MKSEKKNSIPEDILILIFNRLPLKALHRFKAVSKSWASTLLQNPRPPLFLGLFCRVGSYEACGNIHQFFRFIDDVDSGIDNSSAIDSTLSFLPCPLLRHLDGLAVHDCCNGLVLLRICGSSLYVCNPLTKSWDEFSGYNERYTISLLDFDPQVSPYFRIVSFSHYRGIEQLQIRVLSSKTSTMRWRVHRPVRFQDRYDRLCRPMSNHHHHALWEGSLYSLFSNDWMDFGDQGKIMRFGSLEEEERDDDLECQLIELPAGTKNPTRAGIWRLRDKLCLAGFDDEVTNVQEARLRVWSLSTRDQIVWELEHESIISSYLLDLEMEPPNIAGFHPLLDVVFILSQNTVFAYDMEKLSLSKVCPIEIGRWSYTSASIFPFFPSSVDYQVEWEANQKEA